MQDDTMLNAARETLGLDIYPLPIPAGTKRPVLTDWPNLRLGHDDLREHFGNGDGIGWLLGIEPRVIADVDLDCVEALAVLPLLRGPKTDRVFGRASKPHSHYLFELKKEFALVKFKDPLLKREEHPTLIELRGKGEQTVVPPTVHPSGERITWERKGEFGESTFEDLRAWVSKIAAAALLVRYWPGGFEARMAMAGALAVAGWTEDTVAEFCAAVVSAAQPGNREAHSDMARSVRATFEKVERDGEVYGRPKLEELLGESGELIVSTVSKWLGLKRPKTSAADFEEHLTDIGNGARLVRLHGADLRYSARFGWFVWNGQHWAEDETGAVSQRAEAAAISIHAEAAAATKKSDREALSAWAIKSESGPRLREMIACARSKPGIAIRAEDLDKNRWLLNVRNGTVDLKTGKLLTHDRAHLITKIIPVEYDESATGPGFEEFLLEIMCGRDDLVQYLWKLFGYSLTGDTSEQAWWLFHGDGENGKSTLLNVWRAALGPYARHVDANETFVEKRNTGAIRNDLARLRGARLVTAIEVEKGKRLAESLVKQLTGEDPILARFLHKEHFEFMPEFKVIIAANHRPIIRGKDHAVWRRVRLVPFDFVVKKKNDKLADELKRELPGILRWAVRGLEAFQTEKLQPPSEVTAAVEKYRKAMDWLGPFFEECCVVDSDQARTETASNLYRAYVNWAGDGAMPQRTFGSVFGERGFKPDKNKKIGRFWRGISLNAETQAALATAESEKPEPEGDVRDG